MTSVRVIWFALCLLWVFAEIRLARNTRLAQTELLDSERKTQSYLWLSIMGSLGIALSFKHLNWLPIPIQYLPRQFLALSIFASGLMLRYSAISQLGRFFTTIVSIQKQHQLIKTGPYSVIRHPAYSGLLIALFAAGLAMGDFIAWTMLTIISFLAIKQRITIEENMLIQEFSDHYLEYRKNSWKLLPWLY